MNQLSTQRRLPFASALTDRTGGQRKVLRRDCLPHGSLPVIDQGIASVAGYTNDESAAYIGSLPVILFGDHTRALKYVDFPFALGADGVRVLQPSPCYESKFIYYYLLAHEILEQGYSRHFKYLKQITFPLFPFSEQRRIVEILDQADRLRRLRAEAGAKAARVLPALFIKMFGDPSTNPMGWPVKPLGEIGELDRGRSRHRPRNDPTLLGGPYPLIQTGEVANSGGRIREYVQTYSELGLAQSKMWPAGTLCITIAANIASTGILEFDACFPDSVVGFIPGPDTTTEYVQFILTRLRDVLERNAPQVAQRNINLKVLRSLVVPVPPIELQQHFSTQVRKHYDCLSRQSLAHTTLNRLFASTITRAFSGDLTLSWREAHMKELVQEMEQQARLLS